MFLQRMRRHWVPIAIFIGFLLLYVITAVRGVSTADNAEFQWVGATLGLAHPPGFPLYTLLANGASRLPIDGSPAYRINLLSAFTSALTLVFVYLATFRLTRNRLAGLVSVLALGTATTFWAQATVANVRSLTALFAAVGFWVLILIYDLRKSQPSPPAPLPRVGEGGKSSPRFQLSIVNFQLPILFALTVGFGFTHHLSLAFIFLIMVIWLLWLDWRMWKWLPFGLFGLLPWLYLPLHSAELRDPSKFIEYALGLGFGGDFFAFSTPSELWMRAGVMLNVLTFQMSWLLLVAALAGLIVCWVKFRPISILLGGTFLLHTFITATYRAPQTVEYMLPAYVPLALAIGICCGAVGERQLWKQSPFSGRVVNYLLPLVAIVLVLGKAPGRLINMDYLAIASTAERYTHPVFEDAPGGATVLANWHWYTALKYQQEVGNLRSDLRIEYVVPDGESYAQNWVDAISAEIAQNNPVIATNIYPDAYRSLPAPLPLGDTLIWPTEALTNVPETIYPITIDVGGLLEIAGFDPVDGRRFKVGEESRLSVVWRPLGDQPLTMFMHLVGSDGRIYAQDDVALQPRPDGYSMTRFHLTPRIGAPEGEYLLLVGAYGADGVALDIGDGQTRAELAQASVETTFWRLPTEKPEVSYHANDKTLRLGHDYDCTFMDKPRLYQHFVTWRGYRTEVSDIENGAFGVDCYKAYARYVPLGNGIVWMGEEMSQSGNVVKLSEQLAAFRPNSRDIATSVSVVGFADDGQTWAWREQSDSIPATGAIPTLKWIGGSRIRDPHTLTIPDAAVNGQIMEGRLILYDAFTNRPIPVLDERIAAQGVGIPLFERTLDE